MFKVILNELYEFIKSRDRWRCFIIYYHTIHCVPTAAYSGWYGSYSVSEVFSTAWRGVGRVTWRGSGKVRRR